MMRLSALSAEHLLAGGMAVFLVLSLVAIQGPLLGLDSNTTESSTPADVGNTTDVNPPATSLNCSTLAARQIDPGARSPATLLNTSVSALSAGHSASTQGNDASLAAPTGPGTRNGSLFANETLQTVPTTVLETCRLIELYSSPEWVTELAPNRTPADPSQTTEGASQSVEAYRNTSEIAEGQLALARNLRDTLTGDFRSRRKGTFVAAELALAERKEMASARDQNVSVRPQLAAQQVKLQGASDLLVTAETDTGGKASSLSETAGLAETAFEVQVARRQTDTQAVDPGDVTLPTTTPPDHDTPEAATMAILEAHDAELTGEQAAELQQGLGALPMSTREELTDVLDAYLVYYRAVQETNNGTSVQRVRAAQLQILEATADLETALNDTDALGSGPADSNRSDGSTLQIGGVLSIDLSTSHDTYTEDYKFQIDAGGNDSYNNNAGGANASGTSTDAAALIDLGGHDTYNGRNGGGQYLVTVESPSFPKNPSDLIQRPSLPKKGEAAGFLLDAGTGDDTYNGEAHGSNGGGRRGIGLLVDTDGDDTYNGSGTGTNGAGTRKGTGFLLDAGTGSDTYDAGARGRSNGGARGGRGFLFDEGGNDIYKGSNGAAHRGGFVGTSLPIRCETDPREDNIQDPLCKILFSVGPKPQIPQSGGFLLDGGGTDTYDGSNGGAGFRGAGFLLDAGTGDDTYDGTNGGATRRGGTGFLLDLGGNDIYNAGNGAQNGGGYASGFGFLMDGGTGNDTYDVTTSGGLDPVARQALPPGSRGTNGGGWQYGHGFLADAGGNDEYIAGSVAVNGGATREREPEPGGGVVSRRVATGFLLDVAGNDTYTAKEAAVNGGADAAVGLLYDNAGTDIYTDLLHRCQDCSDIPKGTVGAQLDRGSGPRRDGSSTGSTEVLVVDDDAKTASADCQDASYQAIQPAVDAAKGGDTVRVCAGTYPGNVTIATPNVTLRAAESGPVVLDGADKRRFGVALVAGRTTVTGFTARNFRRSFLALGPQITVSHNVIRNSGSGVSAGGLYTDSFLAETPVSQGEKATGIHNNTITNTSLGIKVGTGNVMVSSNTVRGARGGIVLVGATDVTVDNNTVSGQAVPATTEQRGISSIRSSDVTMTDNVVTGFTAPANRTRRGRPLATGIGIEIRTPRQSGGETTHTVRNNTMAANTYNLHVTSGRRSAYEGISIGPSNTVNGKPVLYLVGATNTVIGPDSLDRLPLDSLVASDTDTTRADLPSPDALETPGYVACVDCTNVTIRDLELAHNGQGLLIARSRSTRIENVTVHDIIQGISVQGSPSNTVVKHSTVRESFKGIGVRHNCANTADVVPIIRSPLGPLLGGGNEKCATPSVLLANNTIQQTGFLGRQPFVAQRGYGITGAGAGITVRENTIADGYGTGISMRPRARAETPSSSPVAPGDLLPDAVPNPLVAGKTVSITNSSVIENRISNTSVGVTVRGNRKAIEGGTVVGGNTISNVGLGVLNLKSGLTYRHNRVTNATIGMYIYRPTTDVTARNNSFRDVRWGLDGGFHYFGSSESHNFGTSNTVNGERILWLTGIAHRTIDASDANMVVCVGCVDVTVEDMTIGDNGHGVMLWDSTGSRVRNVTVENTLRTGVLIKGGQNNTVQNTTIIDSIRPIWAMPNPDVPRDVRRDTGAIAPTDFPRANRPLRETVGSVRIVNNRVAVDDASWVPETHIQRPPDPTIPTLWGHFGIGLFNPTKATVTGNHVMGQRWGIYHYQGDVSDLRIENNTITNPRQKPGIGRFANNPHNGGPLAKMLGIRVTAADQSNGSLMVRNNTLTAGTSPIGSQTTLQGIAITGRKVPTTAITDNQVNGYQQSVHVGVRSNKSTISIRRNRLTGANVASVFVSGPTPGDAVEIHQNLLNPLRFGYGVKSSKEAGGGGHMMGGGSGGSGNEHSTTDQQPVNATCNRWAAPSGPSSQRMIVVDPVTNEPANGNGSAVSRGHMHHKSNVRFHPWLGESPRLSCQKVLVGTATPTPIPTPTRTPWPTIGSGDGPGSGSGDGPGTRSGDRQGANQGRDDGGGTGTSTAMTRVPATASDTATPPPTATPEIVPGFGVGVWLLGFALLIALLIVRRRP